MAPFSLWHQKQKTLASDQVTPEGRIAVEPLWTKNFICIWLLNFMICGWSFMINAVYPFYIKHLGGDEMLVGLAMGGYALFCLIMRPITGWVLDHKSRSATLKTGLLGMVGISLLYLFIPALGLVVALRLLNGLIYSGVSTSTNTNACDTVPQSRFGEGISMLGLGNTFATALAPALGLAIMWRLGFDALFYICIALALASWWVSRNFSYKQVKRQAYLKGRYRLRWGDLFNADALPASLVVLLSVVPYGAVNIFVALYGEQSGLGNGGLFFVLVAVGTGSMRMFTGRLADKKGEGPNIILGNIAFLVGTILLLLNSSTCYYLSGLFCGWGFGLSTPAMQAMAVRIVPLSQRGSASSTFLCSYDVGMGLGGLLAGWLVTVWGYRVAFASLSGFVVISTLVYILWASKTPSAFKVYMKSKSAA